MRTGICALVVDDDVICQEIAIRALAQAGIKADAAFGGWQAERLCAANRYDVVITDLQMPNGNGHALCVSLLQRPVPPVLIVVTAITDPRLTRDLLVRGVDDVMFKPLDGQLLTTKVEALLARRSAAESPQRLHESIPRDVELGISTVPVRRLSVSELEGKIAIVGQLLPISPIANEVASMASSESADAHVIAETIKRDPALAAELLKLANSPFYNPSSQTLVDVEKAVVRIGTKRIGELAMATAALDGLTQTRLPWMNVSLAWRRSVAAGIAVDRLCERMDSANNTGLFLSALMHELGRVVLGAVFPDEYKAMIAACERSGTSLLDQEIRVFPTRYTDVMARMLAMWKVAPTVYQPLKHLADSYHQLERLNEPLRSKVELVKIAVLIGQLAVGKWDPWRLVEIPPVAVMARLDLSGIEELLAQTKSDLQAAISQRGAAAMRSSKPLMPNYRAKAAAEIAYLRIGSTRFDFVREIIRSAGIEPIECTPEDLELHDRAIIACLGLPANRLGELLPECSAAQRRLFIADAGHSADYASLGASIALPASFQVIRSGCLRWSEEAFTLA